MSMLMGTSCNSQHLENNQEPPKLENFLGIGEQKLQQVCNNNNNNNNNDYNIYCSTPNNISENNANNIIGLSMIKNWLRNNPNSTTTTTTTPSSLQDDKKEGDVVGVAGGGGNGNNARSLSLSMSMGGDGGGDNSCSSENNKQEIVSGNNDGQISGAIVVPKKSIDTFGQRTSIYRGVTRSDTLIVLFSFLSQVTYHNKLKGVYIQN